MHTGRIVISGVGALSPNGAGREAYFAALAAGRSGVRTITRFDPAALPCRIAAEVDFDPGRWVDPKNLRHVSRVVPMTIAATDEALRDARLDPRALDLEARRSIGVLLGSGGGAIEFSERMYELWFRDAERQASIYSIPSGTIGTIASEISMAWDLHGFSHLISTGCTSSTDAIGYAWRNLKLGVADVIITGGADATITEAVMTGFCMMRIVTNRWNDDPGRGSRPFTRDRDGFILGEGAWMFVMEREETARARGAPIYAEVAGYGSTCDAYHRVRMDDSGEEPARAMTLAMKEAGVDPTEVGYVNYHGTSTELNDRIETRAMKLAFGAHARRLAGSATKSMIGHPQGACGAAGVAATLMAFRDDLLPPTINLDAPDPECDLDYVPNQARRARIDAAVCNTIAFGSKNSALVLAAMLTPRRIESEELLDAPDAPRGDVERSLRDLRWINRIWGGVAVYRRLTRRFSPRSILDVGAGSADLLESATGVALRVGLDFKIDHLLFMRGRSRVHRVVGDARHLPFRSGMLDLVTSSHFLHHFTVAENEVILAEAIRVARAAVAVTDTRRHYVPLLLVRFLGAIGAFGRITRFDAPASIRRGYTLDEARAIAGRVPAARREVVRAWPYRLTILLWKR